jgi:hypothetical protein
MNLRRLRTYFGVRGDIYLFTQLDVQTCAILRVSRICGRQLLQTLCGLVQHPYIATRASHRTVRDTCEEGLLTGVLLFVGCKSPDGPRLALPDQAITTPVPQDYVRVAIFNDTFETLNVFEGTKLGSIQRPHGSESPVLYGNSADRHAASR